MRINLKNSLYLVAAGTLALVLLVYDWIRVTINLDAPVLNTLRNLFSVVIFVFVYAALSSIKSRKQLGPLEILRRLVGYGFITAAVISTWGIFLEERGTEAGVFAPQNFIQLLATTVFALGLAALIYQLLYFVKTLIYVKPEKKVRRRFEIFMGLAIAVGVINIFGSSAFVRVLSTTAFVLAVTLAVLHIVSVNWIVFLSRKDKYKSLGLTFFLMLLFGYSYASVGPADLAGGVMRFYSVPLEEFAKVIFLFLTIYFSLAFIVTVFHIPTSGVFEKKKRELDSYQNLSKVITNVMDTTEVLNNTAAVVGTVTQANKVWIELRNGGHSDSEGNFVVSATHRTSQYELSAFNFGKIREQVQEKKKVVVQDSAEFHKYDLVNFPAKSLIAVSLTAHDEFIGILYAAHDMPLAFDQDEISTVSAFADTAAVAIQNSLLFTKSIENERLQHELRIAHEMQMKLLPLSFPSSEKFDTDFLAFPAFEVGGDYIDYSVLDDRKYAFVVGDVSGKGTSAAFYMAFMKGVFQSLSATAKSPSEFMMAANEAVVNTLQKNFFITLIYAMLDTKSGEINLLRAGHTPAILIRDGSSRLIKPSGVGLGLEQSVDFGKHLEEAKISLRSGDTLVLYTDGATDQRDPSGEEFGEQRFCELLTRLSCGTPTEIKGGIIRALAEHSQGTDAVDDTTVLVLKWK